MTVYPHKNDTWAPQTCSFDQQHPLVRPDGMVHNVNFCSAHIAPYAHSASQPSSMTRETSEPSELKPHCNGVSSDVTEEKLRDCMLRGWTCVFIHYSKAPAPHHCVAEVTFQICGYQPVLQVEVSRWPVTLHSDPHPQMLSPGPWSALLGAELRGAKSLTGILATKAQARHLGPGR